MPDRNQRRAAGPPFLQATRPDRSGRFDNHSMCSRMHPGSRSICSHQPQRDAVMRPLCGRRPLSQDPHGSGRDQLSRPSRFANLWLPASYLSPAMSPVRVSPCLSGRPPQPVPLMCRMFRAPHVRTPQQEVHFECILRRPARPLTMFNLQCAGSQNLRNLAHW